MADCLFCKIAGGEIPSNFLYEDESVVAFSDINPQAPTHILIVPKKHIGSINDFQEVDKDLAAHILVDVVPKIVKDLKIDESGYRVVINTGKDGGQTVPHIHFHILGGRSMQWPPG